MEHSLAVMRGARRVRFLFLPEGEDPDSLVRGEGGREAMAAAIESARPASEVLLGELREGLDLATPDGRAQLVERARAPINTLPPDAFRAEMVAEISRLSGLPADDIRELYAANQPAPRAGNVAHGTESKKNAYSAELPPVTRGFMLLLADPSLAGRIETTDGLRDNDNAGAQILAEAIDFFASNPNVSVAQWLEHHREHRFFHRLQRLAAANPPGDEEQRAGEFVDVVARLQQQSRSRANLRQRYNALVAQQERGPLDAAAAKELKEVLSQLQGRSQTPP